MEFDGVLTGIPSSFCNFRVISSNSVNSGNSVIPLKFPLNSGFLEAQFISCQSEFWNSA